MMDHKKALSTYQRDGPYVLALTILNEAPCLFITASSIRYAKQISRCFFTTLHLWLFYFLHPASALILHLHVFKFMLAVLSVLEHF